jgi:hypothetical protein
MGYLSKGRHQIFRCWSHRRGLCDGLIYASRFLAETRAHAAPGACPLPGPMARVHHGVQAESLLVLHHDCRLESCVSMKPMMALSMTLARPVAMRVLRSIAASIGSWQRRPISAR